MDNTFENVFSRKADDTSSGYHFFNVDNEFYKKHDTDTDICGYFTKFKCAWMHQKLQDIIYTTTGLEKIINRIAHENKPFLEISCGDYMGLTPFILKRNPEIQCLITDIDDTIIYSWHEYCNNPINNLQRFHISFARLDNCDLPIKNESFDYITCTLALNYLYKECPSSFNKALKEIHRVLKKGGRLVSIEHVRKFEFDMERIDQECQQGGAFYGLYPYEILEQVQMNLEKDYYLMKQIRRDQLLSTGFKIDADDNDDRAIMDEKENPLDDVFEEAKKFYSVCANCNTIEERKEKHSKKEELIKTTNYFGVKLNMEKYLLVLHKL